MIQRLTLLLALFFAFSLFGCPQGGGSLGDDDDSADDDDSGADDDDDATPTDDDDATPTDDDDVMDDDDTTDDDDATPEPVTILSTSPVDGAVDVFIGDPISVLFSGETDGTITVADAAGLDVPGTLTWLNATTLGFNANGLLGAETAYTATVSWGMADTADFSFTTSDVGSVPFGEDLTGKTFAFDIASGTVLSPEGGEQFLGQLNNALLMGVTEQSATGISFIGGLAADETDPPEQDFCTPSVDFSENGPAVWNDPNFSAGPADVPQTFDIPNLGALDLTFHDMQVSGTFDSSDGTEVDMIVGASVYTYVDIRDTGLGTPCSQLGIFVPGLVCQPCPQDPSANECVVIWTVGLDAELVPDLTMIPWTQADADATDGC